MLHSLLLEAAGLSDAAVHITMQHKVVTRSTLALSLLGSSLAQSLLTGRACAQVRVMEKMRWAPMFIAILACKHTAQTVSRQDRYKAEYVTLT